MGKNLDESRFYRKVKNKCKDCLNKKLICQVCGKFFTKKRLTSLIERKNHQPHVLQKASKNINNNHKNNHPEKQNNENKASLSAYENHRNVVIGPCNVIKTHHMLKILGKIGNKRPIQ